MMFMPRDGCLGGDFLEAQWAAFQSLALLDKSLKKLKPSKIC